MNIYRDIGSAYLIPLSSLNYSLGIPSTRTERVLVIIYSIFQLIQFFAKPKSIEHFLINCQSYLSYAFPYLTLLPHNLIYFSLKKEELTISCLTRILSRISRPFVNAPYKGEIILDKTIFNLVAKILEIILYEILQRLIGL